MLDAGANGSLVNEEFYGGVSEHALLIYAMADTDQGVPKLTCQLQSTSCGDWQFLDNSEVGGLRPRCCFHYRSLSSV